MKDNLEIEGLSHDRNVKSTNVFHDELQWMAIETMF
jgi:hypothetical protein